MARKNHLTASTENFSGAVENSGPSHEAPKGSFLADFPMTYERWGIGQRLQELDIDADWLEQTYATANISMEHFRKDEYGRKPEVIAAREFFYADLFNLGEVKMRNLKRTRPNWPRPELAFASLENLEKHDYDGRKLAMLDTMVMTRVIDIPQTEAALRKNGFSESAIRRVLQTNPKTFLFNTQSLDQKIKYIKSLGLPAHKLVPKYPRILNHRPDKIGANAAFFDAMTHETDGIVTATPSLLSISEAGRAEVLKIREFCAEHGIDPDRALKSIGGISYQRVVTTHELLTDAGLDADRILASRFVLVNYSAETLRKHMGRVNRYLQFSGFDEEDRRQFMQMNPQSFSASNERLRYLARAINTIISSVPNVEPSVINMTNLGIAVSKAGPELVIKSLARSQKYESLKEYINSLRKASRDKKKNGKKTKKARDYGAYALKLKALRR